MLPPRSGLRAFFRTNGRVFPLLVALLGVAGARGIADEDTPKRWYEGNLSARRFLLIRESSRRLPEGLRESKVREEILLGAPGGKSSLREQRFTETEDGSLRSVEFDSEGYRARIEVLIDRGVVEALISSPDGASSKVSRALDASGPPLGPLGKLLRYRRALMAGEKTIRFRTVVATEDDLLLVENTAELLQGEPGSRSAWLERSQAAGSLVRATYDAEMVLVEATYTLPAGEAKVARREGPAPLEGMELLLGGVMEAAGRPIAGACANRYRLPERLLEILPEDAFQRREGGALIVSSAGSPGPIDDRENYLADEPSIETGKEPLREWVGRWLEGVAERPGERILRLGDAVRARVRERALIAGGGAWETFTSRRGDCTEMAQLLCAALRIAEIPARVEVGLVYDGLKSSWFAHAWVSAYDDAAGVWIHADPAAPDSPRTLAIRVCDGSGPDRFRIRSCIHRFLARARQGIIEHLGDGAGVSTGAASLGSP